MVAPPGGGGDDDVIVTVRMTLLMVMYETTPPEGSVMVPRRRNAMTLQTLRCSREPVLVLRQVLVSGPINPCRCVASAVDARGVRKDVMRP